MMHLADSIGRMLHYTTHHGFWAALKRLLLGCKRLVSGNRLVLFYWDPKSFEAGIQDEMPGGRVERKLAETELGPGDLRRIVSVGYPPTIRRQLSKRFAQGASLWLFKLADQLAAYGWSLSGHTVEPHFFPLGGNDVHLFDFFVFPEYRGRRINPSLVTHILATLAAEGKGRVFIEAAEWNSAQLHSLGRMPFRRLGYARKHVLFGRTVVVWSDGRDAPCPCLRRRAPRHGLNGNGEAQAPGTIARCTIQSGSLRPEIDS